MRSYHSALQLPDGTHEYVPLRIFDQSDERLSRTIDVFCLEWVCPDFCPDFCFAFPDPYPYNLLPSAGVWDSA
jgi:hypothetical protein